MKDLLIGLGLICSPAMIFVAFGVRGFDAFEDGDRAVRSVSAVEQGRVAFAEECARCHGRMAGGTSRGPALIRHCSNAPLFGDAVLREAVRAETGPHADGSGTAGFRHLAEGEIEHIAAFLRKIQQVGDVP